MEGRNGFRDIVKWEKQPTSRPPKIAQGTLCRFVLWQHWEKWSMVTGIRKIILGWTASLLSVSMLRLEGKQWPLLLFLDTENLRGWQDSWSVCQTPGNEKWSSSGGNQWTCHYLLTRPHIEDIRTWLTAYSIVQSPCCSPSCTTLYIDFVKGSSTCRKKR